MKKILKKVTTMILLATIGTVSNASNHFLASAQQTPNNNMQPDSSNNLGQSAPQPAGHPQRYLVSAATIDIEDGSSVELHMPDGIVRLIFSDQTVVYIPMSSLFSSHLPARDLHPGYSEVPFGHRASISGDAVVECTQGSTVCLPSRGNIRFSYPVQIIMQPPEEVNLAVAAEVAGWSFRQTSLNDESLTMPEGEISIPIVLDPAGMYNSLESNPLHSMGLPPAIENCLRRLIEEFKGAFEWALGPRVSH